MQQHVLSLKKSAVNLILPLRIIEFLNPVLNLVTRSNLLTILHCKSIGKNIQSNVHDVWIQIKDLFFKMLKTKKLLTLTDQ